MMGLRLLTACSPLSKTEALNPYYDGVKG